MLSTQEIKHFHFLRKFDPYPSPKARSFLSPQIDLRQKDWEHSQAVKNTTLTPRKYLLIPSENDLLKCTGMCRDLVFRILWFK